MYKENYLIKYQILNPVYFVEHLKQGVIYYNKAMKAPYVVYFKWTAIKEVNVHINNKHWSLIPKSHDMKDHDVLPSVWSMKRNRYTQK